MQEAFVRTYTGWKRVRHKDDPLPYLRSTIVNLARGGLRHRRVVRERRLDVVPDGESAEVSFERDEIYRTLNDAVRGLPERQQRGCRAALLPRMFDGRVRGPLGISEGSVKTHLHRALAALSPRLEELR